MADDYLLEQETASKAVQLCASLTKRLQRGLLTPADSVSKPDFSPVTIGDFAVQALLTAAMHAAFPGDAFIAEETSDELRAHAALAQQVWELVAGAAPRFRAAGLAAPGSRDELLALLDRGGRGADSASGRVWVFDPIDGTATFIRGEQYAINCALLVDGVEQLGIIACPNVAPDAPITCDADVDVAGAGVLVSARRGHGTWKRRLLGDDEEGAAAGELAPAERVQEGACVAVREVAFTDCSTYTSTLLGLHRQVADELEAAWPGVDLFSSLMKYAALGLGHAGVCLRIFKYASWRSNCWDHAGGVLIYEENGGKVTDLEGKAIDFTQGRKMAANYGLVCAPARVHEQVLGIVQKVMKAHGPIPWSK